MSTTDSQQLRVRRIDRLAITGADGEPKTPFCPVSWHGDLSLGERIALRWERFNWYLRYQHRIVL